MCKQPYTVRKEYSSGFRSIPVPCNKCPECISKRVAEWKWRMEQEFKVSTSPLFITLTYNQQSVPRADIDISGVQRSFKVLNPKHLTDYLKLLRFHWDKQSEAKIRYFAVGEYGSKKGRPHYHIILMNCDDVRLICDTWKYGRVDISPVRSIDSVGYCLGYLKKKCKFVPPNHPQFSSKSRGLGRNYINAETISYHNRRLENCTVDLNNGRTIHLPKFMKDKLYTETNRLHLTHYLQTVADKALDEKVLAQVRATGKTEEQVRKEFYVEPFIEKKPKIFPTVF
ncbi:MAG: replication initiator protein [Microviridae sp.]|nr:MAG: replication initiator protein [Microviridae sp.]